MAKYLSSRDYWEMLWMKPNKISMDIEGVLAEICKPWLEKAKEDLGLEMEWDEIRYFENDPSNEVKEHFFKFINDLWETALKTKDWELIPLTESGLVGKLIDMYYSKNLKYDIVTKSQKREHIEGWLEYWGIPFSKPIKCVKQPKTELKYVVFIDDHPDLHKNLKTGQIQILLDKPWNKDVETSENVRRAKNFDEIINILNNLKKENII